MSMWSVQGVADLKAELQQPGLKFETTKSKAAATESTTKVYDHGQEVVTNEPNLADFVNQPTTNDKSTLGLIPDTYQVDDNQTTTSSTQVSTSGEIKRLILDSGAFIMGTNLTLYGPNCEYFTIDEVIAELKDENAKHNFHTFPYPIIIKSPSPESLKYINHISKQTGDYHVLSLTDRKVLALAHQIEVESHGMRYLKENVTGVTIPIPSTSSLTPLTTTTNNNNNNDVQNVPGTVPSKAAKKRANKKLKKAAEEAAAANESATTTNQTTTTPTDANSSSNNNDGHIDPNCWGSVYTCNHFDLRTFLTAPVPTSIELETQIATNNEKISTTSQQPTQTAPSFDKNNGYLCYPSLFEHHAPQGVSQITSQTITTKKQQAKAKFSIPGFDDGEWLSPATVSKLHSQSQMGYMLANAHTATISSLEATQLLPTPQISTEPTTSQQQPTSTQNNKQRHPTQTSQSSVGCITVDYSMQNVMLQSGLRVLTLDGRAITTMRQYIMGCHACHTLSKDMSRGFCPSCGGFTMVRVIVNVDKNGKAQYNWPTGRIENTRGTIFQLSRKQIFGRKGSGKIIVREDMMPRPKLRQLLIARGEKVDPNMDKNMFDESALFGFMRHYQAKTTQYGFGKKNVNIAKRRK